MKPINTAPCATIAGHIHALRTKRALLPIGAALLIMSSVSSFAQIDPAQLIGRGSSGPQTVSRNQLLAPGKAIRAIERARKEIIEGKLDSAEKEIARALEIDPHFAIAKAMQGALDMDREDYARATSLFQQAIDDDPALGAAYVGMAVVLIHQGRFQAALPLIERAEGLLPGAWFVHFAKAWAQLEIGDTASALKQADYAERLSDPDSEKRPAVSYLRAMLSIRMNDLEAARKHLAEAAMRDPGSKYASLAKRELERLSPPIPADETVALRHQESVRHQ